MASCLNTHCGETAGVTQHARARTAPFADSWPIRAYADLGLSLEHVDMQNVHTRTHVADYAGESVEVRKQVGEEVRAQLSTDSPAQCQERLVQSSVHVQRSPCACPHTCQYACLSTCLFAAVYTCLYMLAYSQVFAHDCAHVCAYVSARLYMLCSVLMANGHFSGCAAHFQKQAGP